MGLELQERDEGINELREQVRNTQDAVATLSDRLQTLFSENIRNN